MRVKRVAAFCFNQVQKSRARWYSLQAVGKSAVYDAEKTASKLSPGSRSLLIDFGL
jgi:hypothetical protein